MRRVIRIRSSIMGLTFPWVLWLCKRRGSFRRSERMIRSIGVGWGRGLEARDDGRTARGVRRNLARSLLLRYVHYDLALRPPLFEFLIRLRCVA